MAQNYRKKKLQLINKISTYVSNDDLFALADAGIIINSVLRQNSFPIREYKKWLKKQKQESCSTI